MNDFATIHPLIPKNDISPVITKNEERKEGRREISEESPLFRLVCFFFFSSFVHFSLLVHPSVMCSFLRSIHPRRVSVKSGQCIE